MPNHTPGAPVRINRGALAGRLCRFVAYDTSGHWQETPGWVALGTKLPNVLPPLNDYTKQSKYPRKLLPLSWLEATPEPIR